MFNINHTLQKSRNNPYSGYCGCSKENTAGATPGLNDSIKPNRYIKNLTLFRPQTHNNCAQIHPERRTNVRLSGNSEFSHSHSKQILTWSVFNVFAGL